jgi:GGDEF domain-containing protein
MNLADSRGAEFIPSKHCTEIDVSVGSALYPSEGGTLDELIQIADRNMYQIKNNKI